MNVLIALLIALILPVSNASASNASDDIDVPAPLSIRPLGDFIAGSNPAHNGAQRVGSNPDLDVGGLPREGDGAESAVRSTLRRNSYVALNIGQFYDRDAYIADHVQQLILDEAMFDAKSKTYNFLGTGAMWVAGASGCVTTMLSMLGGPSIISPTTVNVATGCIGAFTTFCIWSSAQLKKSANQYHQASKDIQKKLGIPSELIGTQVDIRLDPLRSVAESQVVNASAGSLMRP